MIPTAGHVGKASISRSARISGPGVHSKQDKNQKISKKIIRGKAVID
jgi:hypothetical protein